MPGRRGRKPTYGKKVRLRDTFKEAGDWLESHIELYGVECLARYKSKILMWRPAGVIAQGLMTAIGILAADYCWANYSSWMRTMNISRTPSEWVVQHVLRKTFPELLADAAYIPDWAKFILERMNLKRFRRAA